METPTGSGHPHRPTRTATPRLSERKRQLFSSLVSKLRKIPDEENGDTDTLGVSPLKPHAAVNRDRRSLFVPNESEGSSGNSSSPETNKENKRLTRGVLKEGEDGGVVVAGTEEHLPLLFTTTMRLNSFSSSSHNSSPKTPKNHKQQADSSMSSPSEVESSPNVVLRRSSRRKTRAFKKQLYSEDGVIVIKDSSIQPSKQANTLESALKPIKKSANKEAGKVKSIAVETQTSNSSTRFAKSSRESSVCVIETAQGIPEIIKSRSNSPKLFLEIPKLDTENDLRAQKTQKRIAMTPTSSDSDSRSPQSKLPKLNLESSIPTMSFYSQRKSGPSDTMHSVSTPKSSKRYEIVKPKARTSPTSRHRLNINKGVHHKIRKKPLLNRMAHTDLNHILKSLNNERLRNLITTKQEERAKVEEVHQILRNARDPIKMAKPLSVISADDANNNNNVWQQIEDDFSDLSDEETKQTSIELEAMEPIIPLIRHEAPKTSPASETVDLSKRKFFKSGRRSSTCMEVKITDNIRASVSQGKIALIQAPRRKPRGVRVKSATIFSAEQATVDAILKNLDDSVVGDIVESEPMDTETAPKVIEYIEPLVEADFNPFSAFRDRLPFQTDDPQIIEQQKILLEFLISNNICNEENFRIFIEDPDNHKEEANKIIDELYMVVNSEEAALAGMLAEPTDLPQVETLDSPIDTEEPHEEAESHGFQSTQKEPSRNEAGIQPKLFPIFTQRLQPVIKPSTRRRPETYTKLLMAAAGGTNQYQIDAGQKAFGARQCQQCGLVYTVHEPEEEQLHRDYHNSIHVLRFKGWIDEDIVAVYPDWSSDARIIRINENAPLARLDRLKELIGVVDKELGYSSYIVPKVFVAFLAVRKQQIVGFCLVQPLSQAHRFIHVDGTDYFSEETYEAKCGVSRIWVSPLHRRCGIASKLLRAVQCHTVLGQEILMEHIAFSTPTDDGRALARKVTGLDNFLTYDQ
ncbi:N-acetyltransferase eco [Drosophila bipectinata]|uniref:N-acetyltransferase eco n=1 Tax=Drosophila bipectinata TaxID=42026 RepID=UPI001C89812E|nr:N-acetyltransferase eco [Drosophila bipectinata]